MIRVDVRTDIAEVKRKFALTERQMGFAIGKAMNDTAFQAREDWAKHVRLMVDRPKSITVRSGMVDRAKPYRLIATVYVRDEATKGTSPLTYLNIIPGGARGHKRFERALIRAGYMYQDEYAVPGSGARMDAYGNVSSGQITQILSAMQASPDAAQNIKRKARRGSKAARSYFLQRTDRGRMKRGIWQRVGYGVRPVLLFTSQRPKYQRRLMFEAVVKRTIARDFVTNFNKAGQREIDRAMARA